MNRYLAKLMFNINIEQGGEASEFDEQIRLIESTNIEDAFYKARVLGKNEEEEFLNQENKKVSWKFIDVMEMYPLENVKDGSQIYSNTHKTSDADSFIKYIRQKSIEIQVKNLTFA